MMLLAIARRGTLSPGGEIPDEVVVGEDVKGRLMKNACSTQTVMPNWFRHLMNSGHYETLKRVQGDKKEIFSSL
jgi:hypothetical protein